MDLLVLFYNTSNFYPRPPRGGRLRRPVPGIADIINFYPRPPRGGRLTSVLQKYFAKQFLSTPSARRATQLVLVLATPLMNFYPRPPRGGRPLTELGSMPLTQISIHALREEGDSKNRDKISIFKQIIQHSARI